MAGRSSSCQRLPKHIAKAKRSSFFFSSRLERCRVLSYVTSKKIAFDRRRRRDEKLVWLIAPDEWSARVFIRETEKLSNQPRKQPKNIFNRTIKDSETCRDGRSWRLFITNRRSYREPKVTHRLELSRICLHLSSMKLMVKSSKVAPRSLDTIYRLLSHFLDLRPRRRRSD